MLHQFDIYELIIQNALPMSSNPGSKTAMATVNEYLKDHLFDTVEDLGHPYPMVLHPHGNLDEQLRAWDFCVDIADIQASMTDVKTKVSALLNALPLPHEVIVSTGDREDFFVVVARAEKGSQNCLITITYIQRTGRMKIQVMTGTTVSRDIPWHL